MNLRESLVVSVDEEGRLVLPSEMSAVLGLRSGLTVAVEGLSDGLRIRRPVDHLAKVYVEPTSRCNLACVKCMRRAWETLPGDMTEKTFAHLLEGLAASDPLPAVFFGGLGEPLVHPRIVEMVAAVKALGVPRVELITNGCLLDEEASRRLIAAGLDRLWVSLDGIRPESYGDLRAGALLERVLENLRAFKVIRRGRQIESLTPDQRRRFEAGVPGWHDSWRLPEPAPELGIVFVAMRRNIADLPGVVAETHRLGARHFMVTNVLPYTLELAGQMLCQDRLAISPFPTLWDDRLRLPQMDIDESTREALMAAVHSYETGLAEHDLSNVSRRCPFVEAGSTTITWDGKVAPCLSLGHSHEEFFNGRLRRVQAHSFGLLEEASLLDIWALPEYVAFRRRVQAFDFGPCLTCKRCSLPDHNQEDCVNDASPVCGACLWSQGVVQCP